MTFWKTQNYGDSKETSGCQGPGGMGRARRVQGGGASLCDTVMVCKGHHAAARAHGRRPPHPAAVASDHIAVGSSAVGAAGEGEGVAAGVGRVGLPSTSRPAFL